jgi:23S rRNA pseudouridine1911/1915/1917 synthase
MSLTTHTVTTDESHAGQRLDRVLAILIPDLSRSRLQALIDQGCVHHERATIADASLKVKPQQTFTVRIPETVPSHIVAQDIALDIIYEDEHLLVINKPAGLTVHPAPGHADMTLVNALLAHCGDSLSGIGGVARPGIVHRIDKDTSGLLVVAKHDAAHIHLSEQLATRTLKRTYTALVWGTLKQSTGSVTGNIGRSVSNRQKMAVVKSGGKPATTHYQLLEDLTAMSLVECKLETGRTHQIRVHMMHIGHPLVGDPVYGQTTQSRMNNTPALRHIAPEVRSALLAFNRQALHARELGLIHPITGKTMQFSCPIADDMQVLIQQLRQAAGEDA